MVHERLSIYGASTLLFFLALKIEFNARINRMEAMCSDPLGLGKTSKIDTITLFLGNFELFGFSNRL